MLGQNWCFQQDVGYLWQNPHWAGNTRSEGTAVRPAGEWPGARSRVTDPLAAGHPNVISVLFLRTVPFRYSSWIQRDKSVRHWTMKHHHQLFRCFWRTLVTLLLCEGTPLMMFRGSLTLTLNRDHSSFTLQQDARIAHSSHNGMKFSALNIVLNQFVASNIASKQLYIYSFLWCTDCALFYVVQQRVSLQSVQLFTCHYNSLIWRSWQKNPHFKWWCRFDFLC